MLERSLERSHSPTREDAESLGWLLGRRAQIEALVARLFRTGEHGRRARGEVLLMGQESAALGAPLGEIFDTVRLEAWPGPSTELPIAAGTYATVCAYGSLHRLEEPGVALREAVRILRPGGTLLVFDLHRPGSESHLEELVQRHGAAASEAVRAAMAGRLRAALTPEELRMEALVLRLFEAEIGVEDELLMSLRCISSGA